MSVVKRTFRQLPPQNVEEEALSAEIMPAILTVSIRPKPVPGKLLAITIFEVEASVNVLFQRQE